MYKPRCKRSLCQPLTLVPMPGLANDANDAAMDVPTSTNKQRPKWKVVPAKIEDAFHRLQDQGNKGGESKRQACRTVTSHHHRIALVDALLHDSQRIKMYAVTH